MNLSGGGVLVPSPSISSKGGALTKRFVGLHVQNDRDIRSGTCIPSPESLPPKNLDHGSKALAVLAALGGSAWRSLPRRTDEIARPRSNGGHNDEDVHQPPQLHDPPFAPTQGTTKAAEVPNPAHFIQVLPLTLLPIRTTYLSTSSVGPGFGLVDLDTIAARQVAQEDHLAAKAKVSSSKHTQRRKPTIPASAPSTTP